MITLDFVIQKTLREIFMKKWMKGAECKEGESENLGHVRLTIF